MARRKFATLVANNKQAVCYYNSEIGEFSVVFFRDNVKQVDADYFAPDRQDALDTAQHFVNFE
jgi:hypothetical protein